MLEAEEGARIVRQRVVPEVLVVVEQEREGQRQGQMVQLILAAVLGGPDLIVLMVVMVVQVCLFYVINSNR
jgi:hypothetical protein